MSYMFSVFDNKGRCGILKEDMTKTGIIRQSIKEVLKDAEIHTVGEIKEYIKEKYPDIIISDSTFNTIFSRQKGTIHNLQSFGNGRYQIAVGAVSEKKLVEYCMIDEYIQMIESEFDNIYNRNKNARCVDVTTEWEFIAAKAILESNKRLRNVFYEEKKHLELAKEKIKLLAEFEAKNK